MEQGGGGEGANSGGERSQQFFNPGSSSALIMSSLINSTAVQNIHFWFTVVKTSGSFTHPSTVANR